MSERVCLVSGAASGIGRRLATTLVQRGYRVMALDSNAQALDALFAERGWNGSSRILKRVHDVRDSAGWEGVLDALESELGPLDLMLNVAGTLKPGYIHRVESVDIDRQIDINTKGVMYATNAAAKRMVPRRSGHILNIASLAGITPVPGLSIYSASKHAVRGFTLSIAYELRPHGVSVSVVCPDAVETPMLELQTTYDEAAATFGGGRGLTLDEIETAILETIAKRPIEKVVPIPGTGRGILSKLANTFPALMGLGLSRTLDSGRRAQAKRRS